MYAEIKSNNKILINRLDSNERILLEDFCKKVKDDNLNVLIEPLLDECGDFGGIFVYTDGGSSPSGGLTPEQIEAVNNIQVDITDNGELTIEYDDSVLDLMFSLSGNDLIVNNNVDGLSFNINNRGELEAIY